MKILFMSTMYPKEQEKQVRSKMKRDMDDASNVLQWNIIDGIESNGVDRMFVVNHLPVDSWPKNYADKKVCEFSFSHKPGAKDINPSFCNITYLKQLLMKGPYSKCVKRWCLEPGNEKVIIAYSLTPLFLETIKAVKKINPEIKAFAVVADLPEYAVCSKNKIKQIYCDYNKKHIDNLLGSIDGFVLLTKHMAEKLNIKVPYTVMEGIAPTVKDEENDFNTSDIKTILYTGSMNKQYGILTLLEAFSKTENSNYRLVLCGLGDAENEIRDMAVKDKRVQYLGKVTHDKILDLQKQATVLVNPRQNIEEFSRYSFPSKTMEYLSSGTPMIGYKLDGIPDEYDDYIFYVKDNSAEALRNQIVYVCESDRKMIGRKAEAARLFVKEKKNNVVQAKKILDFIQRSLEENE